jgi:hypothetical protein
MSCLHTGDRSTPTAPEDIRERKSYTNGLADDPRIDGVNLIEPCVILFTWYYV